ncbi:hypothetical protein NQ315_003144, partial [Exocentrus adspersus]
VSCTLVVLLTFISATMYMQTQTSRFKAPTSNRGQHSSAGNQYYNDYSFHRPHQNQTQYANYYGQTTSQGFISFQQATGTRGLPPHQAAVSTRGFPPQQQRQQQKRNRGNQYKIMKNRTTDVHQREDSERNHDIVEVKDTSGAFLCPGCSTNYDYYIKNNRYMGRIPLVLHCHHTCCQECIYKGVIANSFACPSCNEPSDLSDRSGNEHLQELFTFNYYVMGVITCTKPRGYNPNKCNNLSLVPTQVTLNNRKVAIEPPTESESEPDPEGECSTVVHKSAKSLWSHIQVPFTNGNLSAELQKCPEHATMDVEFFCSTCDTGACCYCFIDKHEGHEKIYLSKLNKDELEELQTLKDEAEHVLRQLLISQKKLKKVTSPETSALEKRISQYFVDLHGGLDSIYRNLLKEAANSEGGVGGGEKIKSSLDNSVKMWKNILSAADNVSSKKTNLRWILEKLRGVKETPCYLLSEATAVAEAPEFHADSVLENLSSLFTIEKRGDRNLRLVKKDELPSDYEKDSSDVQYENDADILLNSILRSSRKSENNFSSKKTSCKSLPTGNKKSSGQKRHKIDKKAISEIGNILQIPLDNERVEVTHIESLECFYVQFKKNQLSFIQMNEDIENYVKMVNEDVGGIEVGELYLVLYSNKKEKMWCRGRIAEIIKSEGAETLYEVQLIDYGSTQMVDISKLRNITPQLAQRKPFAVQCELYNPANNSWGKNAHVYMGKIINGKELYMVVKNVDNGVYTVDLMISSSDRGLTSIIDILIHTCSNVLSSSSDSLNSVKQKTSSFSSTVKIFANSFKFHRNQSQRVIIAKVIDPHHIFVHIADYVDLLKSLSNELKRYYKNNASDWCVPVEGTYAVVEYRDPIRGNWHRAFVKKVDMLQTRAHVLLVDWGTTVVVPWASMRVLKDSFTRLESQAILIKLAHVEPYQGGDAWTESATLYLEKNFRIQEPLLMTVYSVDPLEVALFEMENCVNLCINAQLVHEKLADSTGKISQTLKWPKEDEQQPCFNEEEGLVATLLKKADEIGDEDSLTGEEEEDAEVTVKQKIDVVKVVSPSLIYIKFLHLKEEELKLYKELHFHYNKEKESKETWEAEEGCVVLMNDNYTRGKIICPVEDKFKVDLGFQKIIYKCHLANVRPAGGDQWSLSSTEVLEKTFEKHRDIYTTKTTEVVQQTSMPMLMWYTKVKIGGALEPSITKFISINKLLVKLGFAYNDVKVEKEDNKVTTSAMVHFGAAGLDKSLESGSESEATQEEGLATSAKSSKTRSTDWIALIEEEENSASNSKHDSPYHTREAEITDWKPPFPIKKYEFKAFITCADIGGILYLRDEDLQPVYQDMENNLKQYFDSQSPSLDRPVWQPGQICTISYKDYWYRGKILRVDNPKEILAVMIDFGSEHLLQPEQLHREILYPEIPAFASKVKLDRIYAKSGQWMTSDYDTLVSTATERARIVIQGSLNVEVPSAEVYNEQGQSLNDLMVKLCPNLTRSLKDNSDDSEDEMVVLEKETAVDVEPDIQIDTTSMRFVEIPIPEKAFTDKIQMDVVGILFYNKVVLRLAVDAVFEDRILNLNTDIQDFCEKQPVLDNIEVGMPCVCPYAEDGLWYRARIHNIEGIDCGYVFVFFVDFGNVESVPIDNVRMMKEEWFKLPMPCYIADVNIELQTENYLEHILQLMKKLFMKTKWVRFVLRDPLMVDLYEDSGALYYESLVSNGLLKVKK